DGGRDDGRGWSWARRAAVAPARVRRGAAAAWRPGPGNRAAPAWRDGGHADHLARGVHGRWRNGAGDANRRRGARGGAAEL
ncbi:MAG: hypothetical protein AVDCRST_MAG04-1472, partial [uncultured Acetobacteraceae bacterium]